MSMVPLAILTLATTATGSIAIGGVAASAAALGEAVGGPTGGALADRWGQRSVLLAGVLLHVASLTGFALSAGRLADALTVGLAGLTGLTLPQVGALSRARWLAIAPGRISAAFAFEGVVDEVVYIIGPALVGLVAVGVSPLTATIGSGVLVAIFVTWFATHSSHRQVPRRRPGTRSSSEPMPWPDRALIGVAFVGMLLMGTFFGGCQTGLTDFARAAGIPSAGPLLYAAMAVGSAATTLAMVAVPDRVGPWSRWFLAGAGQTAGAVLMLFAPDVPMIVAAGLIAGMFQGPLLLTIFSVAGSVTRTGRSGITMTLTASGVVLGLATGAAVAGLLADRYGAPGAFAVVIAASAILTLLGGTMVVRSRQ